MRDKLNYKDLNELIKTGRILLKIGLIAAIGSLFVLLFFILEKIQILKFITTILSLMMPLFIGIVFAWLFEPLILKLEDKKIKRGFATTIVYLAFILVTVILLILVVPEFISQLKELVSQVPLFLGKTKEFIADFFNKFSNSELDIETIKLEITTRIEKFANSLTDDSLSKVIDSITNAISEGFTFILGILIAFYLSIDFKKFNNGIAKFIPNKYKDDVKGLAKTLNDMARGYVSGTLFTSLLVAFLTFLGLIISGVGSPLLFAIFCGVTNIIPYFGPYIGGIPVIIIGFSINPMCGIICLITIVLVQFIEGNIIHPLIVGKAVDIHPIVIVISLLIFEYYFGTVGMIIATPVVGGIKILFNFFDSKYHFTNRIKPDRIAVK